MWAWTIVSSPGASVGFSTPAVTQPQETRTLETVTGDRVLLTSRNGCVSAGPLGTEPKSFDSSSKRESAQEAAPAGAVRSRPARRTSEYRIEPFPAAGRPGRAAIRGAHAAVARPHSGHLVFRP